MDRMSVKRYELEAQSHAHWYHQIVLPLRGELEMDIDGRVNRVRDDQGAIFAQTGCIVLLVWTIMHSSLNLATDKNGMCGTLTDFWSAASNRPFIKVDRSARKLCQFVDSELQKKTWRHRRKSDQPMVRSSSGEAAWILRSAFIAEAI